MLDGRLHLEDQSSVGAAQVEIAPVDALVERGFGCDGQFGLGGRVERQRAQLDLEAAELDSLVGEDETGDRDGRLRRQCGDLLGELVLVVVVLIAGMDELDEPCLVAQDDELDALLVADRMNPAAESDGLVEMGFQIGDERAGQGTRNAIGALSEPLLRRRVAVRL